MIGGIPSGSLGLLKECLASHGELLRLVTEPELVELTAEQKNRIRGILGDELVRSGLRDDDEPNERGLALEDLIDYIGTPA